MRSCHQGAAMLVESCAHVVSFGTHTRGGRREHRARGDRRESDCKRSQVWAVASFGSRSLTTDAQTELGPGDGSSKFDKASATWHVSDLRMAAHRRARFFACAEAKNHLLHPRVVEAEQTRSTHAFYHR